jgi:hypothetical protein
MARNPAPTDLPSQELESLEREIACYLEIIADLAALGRRPSWRSEAEELAG